MKRIMIAITSLLAMAVVQSAMAGEGGHAHMHGDQHKEMMHEHSLMPGDMNHVKDEHGHHTQGDITPMNDMFLVKKEIDGFTVSFHAMKVKEGMEHGGSHNLMVKVEKDGKALTDLTANSKVTHPNGKSESKMLMKMGDWYMAGYDLEHAGKHQLMVLFKTADGAKHFGGVYYPGNR